MPIRALFGTLTSTLWTASITWKASLLPRATTSSVPSIALRNRPSGDAVVSSRSVFFCTVDTFDAVATHQRIQTAHLDPEPMMGSPQLVSVHVESFPYRGYLAMISCLSYTSQYLITFCLLLVLHSCCVLLHDTCVLTCTVLATFFCLSCFHGRLQAGWLCCHTLPLPFDGVRSMWDIT